MCQTEGKKIILLAWLLHFLYIDKYMKRKMIRHLFEYFGITTRSIVLTIFWVLCHQELITWYVNSFDRNVLVWWTYTQHVSATTFPHWKCLPSQCTCFLSGCSTYMLLSRNNLALRSHLLFWIMFLSSIMFWLSFVNLKGILSP